MQSKENKNLVIIFRICIFAAFITGLMYVFTFVNAPKGSEKEQAVQVLSGFFYAYMVFTLVSLVLSIICFKTTSTVSSVIRTISLAATSIILLMNMSFIGILRDAVRATSGDYDRLEKLNRDMEKLMKDPAVAGKSLLSFASILVMLILAITSVVALVKALKGNVKPADAA